LPPKQVFEFLKPILEHETTTAGDAWAYRGSGGYVLRFDLDITGDGQAEMFLASTLYFQRGYGTWRPYLATEDGAYKPFDYEFSETGRAGLNLYGTAIWLETPASQSTTKSILTFGSDRGKYYVGRYSFRDAEIVFERSEVAEAKFPELKAGPNIKRVAPEVRGVLLADLLRNPNAEWKPIDFKSAAPSPEGYYIAPDDAERVKGFVNFTPDLALRWLASAAAGKTPIDTSAVPIPLPEPHQTPDASPTAMPKTSSPAPVVAETPAPIAERKSAVWPWVVGILALVVIVAVALKRRA